MKDKHIFTTERNKEFYIEEGCHIIEIMNTLSSPDISVSQARVEPLKSTELHSLNDTKEYYYILEGTGIVEINGKKSKVSKGDLVKIDVSIHQKITNLLNSDLVFLCICTPRFEPQNYISEETKEI